MCFVLDFKALIFFPPPFFVKMLPMLVYSLNNNQGNENLWSCSLKSLEDLISSSDTNLNDYLKEILDKLFELSKYKDNMVSTC